MPDAADKGRLEQQIQGVVANFEEVRVLDGELAGGVGEGGTFRSVLARDKTCRIVQIPIWSSNT